MTDPQPATPGSDSVRAQIAEEIEEVWPDCSPEEASRMALDLVPLVDRLRAEAKAEALEEMACHALYNTRAYGPVVPLWRLRDRAAAYRTNPSSKETHRG